MNILEIEHSPKTETSAESIRFAIGNRHFLLIAGPRWVTVIAGKAWIDNKRALGKTYHSRASLVAAYKDGELVAEFADKLATVFE